MCSLPSAELSATAMKTNARASRNRLWQGRQIGQLYRPPSPVRCAAICIHIFYRGIIAATYSQPPSSAHARLGDCNAQHERCHRCRPLHCLVIRDAKWPHCTRVGSSSIAPSTVIATSTSGSTLRHVRMKFQVRTGRQGLRRDTYVDQVKPHSMVIVVYSKDKDNESYDYIPYVLSSRYSTFWPKYSM